LVGKYCRSGPLVSSLLPRCEGDCASATKTPMPVAALNRWWSAISVPRSQLKDRRSPAGRAVNAVIRARLLTLAVCHLGR
jgi:hypothetical protein